MERLQQYDFEMIYRKGISHKNADGLSRRLCANNSCQYCARVKVKKPSNLETIARITLFEENLENWRKEQFEYSSISYSFGKRCWGTFFLAENCSKICFYKGLLDVLGFS